MQRAREKTGGHWMRVGSPRPRAAAHQPPVFRREALGVVLHKESRWYQQWKDFRDNNVVFNRESPIPGDSTAVTGQYQHFPGARHKSDPHFTEEETRVTSAGSPSERAVGRRPLGGRWAGALLSGLARRLGRR